MRDKKLREALVKIGILEELCKYKPNIFEDKSVFVSGEYNISIISKKLDALFEYLGLEYKHDYFFPRVVKKQKCKPARK